MVSSTNCFLSMFRTWGTRRHSNEDTILTALSYCHWTWHLQPGTIPGNVFEACKLFSPFNEKKTSIVSQLPKLKRPRPIIQVRQWWLSGWSQSTESQTDSGTPSFDNADNSDSLEGKGVGGGTGFVAASGCEREILRKPTTLPAHINLWN